MLTAKKFSFLTKRIQDAAGHDNEVSNEQGLVRDVEALERIGVHACLEMRNALCTVWAFKKY